MRAAGSLCNEEFGSVLGSGANQQERLLFPGPISRWTTTRKFGSVPNMSVDPPQPLPRINSIDAARGLVMFTMIFVNDIAGVSHQIVPDWMRHFHGRSGMTFVDLVFPAFLFMVGMSIPSALGGRLLAGEPVWKILLHVVARTFCLLLVGVLMVNDESPGPDMSGLSPDCWAVLMYLSAILAFCSISPAGRSETSPEMKWRWQSISRLARAIGFAGLLVLAFLFRGDKGQRIISLSPFVIHTSWFGILGLIAWAYLAGSIVFLAFRCNSLARLGCMALLLALYPADKTGVFDNFWLNRYVGIGGTLGAQPSITVAGSLLASILPPWRKLTLTATLRFTAWFILGCAAAALLLEGLYGINKNEATPSWCLWACAVTALVWLVFHLLSDLGSIHPAVRVFALAGRNVLLAYLFSEMLPSAASLSHLDDFLGKIGEMGFFAAVLRSAGLAAAILAVTIGLNRIGFRLKI
jgi:predicted acyltransferase